MKLECYSSLKDPFPLHHIKSDMRVKPNPYMSETKQSLTKTAPNLKSLIPALQDIIANTDHEIGESYFERGVGLEEDYASNTLGYNEDGLEIEIHYQCCGEWYHIPGDRWTPDDHSLRKAWGEILSIDARWENEETGECYKFNDEEVSEILIPLEEYLNKCLIDYVGR
ncbi:MAG: hypothetical protein K2J70_00070 [Muribaculaceae bacterium]|nr:hypothetical protein [Muribaculaceae bacterium]